MGMLRGKKRVVRIGTIAIGGNNPVAIQSMTKVKTSDVEKTIAQVNMLAGYGCEIIRVAVKDMDDARAIRAVKNGIHIPLVADIHFDHRLALAAIESGADKIRLNPGNIYKKVEVQAVVSALKGAKIPLRIGANSGSVKEKDRKTMAARLVASVLKYVRMVEKMKFHDIVISLKGSTVLDTIEAYRQAHKACEYPLHLGVTATGSPRQGAIKSSIALGILLNEGIGDTMRISLTDKPQEEISAARAVLEALELRSFGPQLASCPTCGRCEVDLISVVAELEKKMSLLPKKKEGTQPLKVAVMGCVVNGPGEASEADIGIAFGKDQGLLFKGGKPVRKVALKDCVDVLLKEIKKKNV